MPAVEHTIVAPPASDPAPAPPPRGHRLLGRRGPTEDPHRPQRVLTLLLLAGLLLPWVTAGFEWPRLRSTLAFAENPPPWAPWDALALWVLAVKTYLVLLPGLAAACALALLGWARVAVALYLVVAAGVFAWVGVDLETFTRTGAHATHYAEYALSPEAAKWAGDVGATAREAFLALLPVASAAGGLFIASGMAATLVWRRGGRAGRAAVTVAVLAVAHVLLLVLIAPAQAVSPEARRKDLQRLHDLLPYNLVWTAPGVRLVDVDAFQGPLNERLEPVIRAALSAMNAGVPADSSPAAIPATGGTRPNVVMVIVDSLRADAMVPEVMPRLSALARRGLVLDRHYSGARSTHLSLFGILYGRPPAAYRPTLRANVPPQMCVSMRGAGYQASYVSSVPHFAWMRMHTFLNDQVFDRMRVIGLPDWPASDRGALAAGLEILAGKDALATNGAPQFLTVFLASAHFPYAYPPEFDTRRPVLGADWGVLSLDPTRDRPALRNRYLNACSFVDDAVADFVEQIDLSNTVVVITGDHGQSFWDDGFLIHGTRWSDVQAVVTCVLLGPGIAPGRRADLTTHQDLLPTLLRLAGGGRPVAPAGTTGRDLFGGEPASDLTVLTVESDLERFQMLVSLRERRMLLEVPLRRPAILVKGTVDPKGRVDPYDLPPAREADEWAKHLKHLFTEMTALPPRP